MARSNKADKSKGGYAQLKGILEITDGKVFIRPADSEPEDLAQFIAEFDNKFIHLLVEQDTEY